MPANNIAKKVRFIGIDGFVILPILTIMIFPSVWLLISLLAFSLLLFIIEKRGMSIFMLARRIRTVFAGRHRFIRPPWRKRQ